MNNQIREIDLNKWQSIVNRDKTRFLVLNCGRRSGKSTYSAIRIIQFAMDNAGSITYYVSPSYKQSKAIMWQILRDAIPSVAIRSTNETELVIELVNNSRIELKGADAEPDRLRGVRIDFLVCDEVASFRNWSTVWNKVLRPTLIDSKGSAIFISTPQGFNFWYDLYNTQDPEYKSYTFTTFDNEYIDPVEIEKIKAELDEETYRQEILAEFTQVSGVVYKEWNFNDNFKEIEYEPTLPVNITIDFGVNDPTAILWIQRNGGEFRVFDYYEASNASIDNICQLINSKPYKQAELITGDPAGKARSITTGTSPIEEMSRHGLYVKTKDGVMITEQIRIAHKYMKSLYVSKKCERLRDCIHNYRYPTKKENTINQSNEIPIHDEYSHAMRAIEYYFVNIDQISTPLFNYEQPEYLASDSVIGI